MRHLFLITAIYCWSAGELRSQSNPFIFRHLSEKDGLGNKFINSLFKDSRGYMWVGTYEGLARFDGSHFYTFRQTGNENSIINNIVHDICEDKKQRIWGATENGIFCYDPVTDRFSRYYSPIGQASPTQSNIARSILNIVCDKQGNIWATGTWTILKFDPGKDRFVEIGPLTKHPDSLGYYSVRKNGMIEDPAGKGLWMATRVGIHYYDFGTGQFSSFKDQNNPLFAMRNVAALATGKDGRAWFFDNTTKEIIGFETNSKKITRRIDIGKAIPGAVGATLFEDDDHRLWFSSWNSRIAIVDPGDSLKITRIQSNQNDPYSISTEFFWSATQDEDGTVWLGTPTGIARCNPGNSLFRVHRLSDKFPFLNGNSIRLIVEDPKDKSWWLVTQDQLMVIHFFPGREQFESYDFQYAIRDARGALPGPVFAIQFFNGRPVLGTHTGAWVIDPAAKKILPFHFSEKIDKGFITRFFYIQDRFCYLSDGHTLLIYDRQKEEVKTIKYQQSKLPDGQNPVFSKMSRSLNNRIWFMAAFGWLGNIDSLGTLNTLYLIKDEVTDLSGNLTTISPDKEGNLWIVSPDAGFYHYNTTNGQKKFWNRTQGLLTNRIQSILADEQKNVWTVGENKFSVLNTATGRFNNFSVLADANRYNYDNAMALLSNGHIAVSVVNDIFEFDPKQLEVAPKAKMPLISNVDIAGRQEFILPGEELKLDPDERTMILSFGLLTDNNIFPYSFEYKLDGIDKSWIQAGASNQAVYNKLPPGKYTFRLVARGSNGNWLSPETILKIHIRTPFFRSYWFYGSIILLVASALYFFYRFRSRKQRELYQLTGKAQLLEKEKALVMYEALKQQLNPHFLFNSLTSLNSLISADPKMAHEFLDSLSKTYRYILKSRDNETVLLSEELRFATNYVKLQQTRFEKGLEVHFRVPDEYSDRRIVPVTLQNLVENAIKHNIIDEDSPLVIDIYVQDDHLYVRNNLQKKNFVETSNRQGLASLRSLYDYLSDRPVEIKEDAHYFTVKLPLL